MSRDVWSAVDRYFEERLAATDPVLEDVLRACDQAGLPPHAVSPMQGRLLALLAGLLGARRILEIGTLGGYSAIWLARALPADGRLVTLESDPAHARVARANFVRAGVEDRVELLEGEALASLPKLADAEGPPFDLVFIDADKARNLDYFRWALALADVGSAIVVDNVVRGGEVVDGDSRDPGVLGVRRLADWLASQSASEVTVLQTVGVKGYDGLLIARVVEADPARPAAASPPTAPTPEEPGA
ncbi:MAG: O-methyltransferase [Myxococcota bacterium]